MKESAVDCQLNRGENEPIKCLRIDGHPDQYLFDPDLEVDKLITSITFKEQSEDVPVSSGVLEKALEKVLGSAPSAPIAEHSIRLGRIQNTKTGMYYLIYEKKGSSGSIAQLFDETDVERKKPLGELTVDIMTGQMSDPRMYT